MDQTNQRAISCAQAHKWTSGHTHARTGAINHSGGGGGGDCGGGDVAMR